MTGNELLERFNLGEKLTVRFTEEVENGCDDSQWEEGMLADVIDVCEENNLISISVDSTKYIDFNKIKQKPIWFNAKTRKYDAARDEFLVNEEDYEIYDDVFWIGKNDNIIYMVIN